MASKKIGHPTLDAEAQRLGIQGVWPGSGDAVYIYLDMKRGGSQYIAVVNTGDDDYEIRQHGWVGRVVEGWYYGLNNTPALRVKKVLELADRLEKR